MFQEKLQKKEEQNIKLPRFNTNRQDQNEDTSKKINDYTNTSNEKFDKVKLKEASSFVNDKAKTYDNVDLNQILKDISLNTDFYKTQENVDKLALALQILTIGKRLQSIEAIEKSDLEALNNNLSLKKIDSFFNSLSTSEILKDKILQTHLIKVIDNYKANPNPRNVINACDMISELKSAEAANSLYPIYASEIREVSTYPVRAAAVRAAVKIGGLTEDMRKSLYDRMEDASVDVSLAAIKGLFGLKENREENISELVRVLTKRHSSVCQIAILNELLENSTDDELKKHQAKLSEYCKLRLDSANFANFNKEDIFKINELSDKLKTKLSSLSSNE